MSAQERSHVVAADEPSGERDLAAIATLLLLSPVIGEVMSGATRLSYIVVLLPEIMVWGCGTLIIRDLVRRWRGGWTSVLLLGIGLAIAEEFVIQQTSLAPLPFPGSAPGYGRVWGVNWPYFVFMLGYEAVWIVLVPIQVSELIFARCRDRPWLRPRGILTAAAVFLAGSFVAWFLWTQLARPNVFHVPVYRPPASTVSLGVLAILLLALAAYAVRGLGRAPSSRVPPRPWVVLWTALGLGFPWYLLMSLVFAPNPPDVPLAIPVALAGAWASGAYLLIRRWTSTSGWLDTHRWALCFGALLVSMIAGFLGASFWSRLDVIAKALLNVAAIACMLLLRVKILARPADRPR